jgi:hypothetical protein
MLLQEAPSLSPGWGSALPSTPDTAVKITPAYAAHVARDAYFWTWPLINIDSRRRMFSQLKDFKRMGPVPIAPLNRLEMLTDYIAPEERVVACPNQDVVYGLGVLALDVSPVVVQVPDFKGRFWVYQIVDMRTDGFAQLGAMYATQPGFYLLVGRDWTGDVPKGITQVFQCPTDTGCVIPRVFQDDSSEDRKAIQSVLRQIMMYPLSEYNGMMQEIDWNAIPQSPPLSGGDEEMKWVVPEKFMDQLPAVLAAAPPLPGEEARYAQVLAVLKAVDHDPSLKEVMTKAAAEAEDELVVPLFQFRNYGRQLAHHWSTIVNEAAFGTDYFTRTAVAKSNIFVNAPKETKYFYQDLDADGSRLNGANRYTVTFAKRETPPVNGFWSLTLYNEHHFFEPNSIKRYSLGTKNRNLKYNDDGSLTLYVQPDEPEESKRDNWLPSPKDRDFSLYVRTYWPKPQVTDGSWTPPPVKKA